MFAFEKAIVRIYDRAGRVIGAGFLAAQEIVLTCKHVVGQASEATLDFPLVPGGRKQVARVIRRDPKRDVAVLRLEALPSGAEPVRLVSTQDSWGHPFRAFGFPQGYPRGVWADGKLRAPIADTGWLQIEDVGESGYFVQPGFSGTPVWDEEVGGVVGMVVAADRTPDVRAAFCIPAEQLIAACPDLGARVIPPNPYRGLLYFREQDASFFFGREDFSERLVAEVQRHPLIAVVGSSGSGKSSVVLAGLLPRLRPQSEWAIATMRPGGEPFEELAGALLPLLEPEMSETDRLREIPKLAAFLRSGEIPVARLARRILRKQGGEWLLIVVDQLEELYTLCDDKETRQTFIDRWLEGLREEATPLRLVLTLRADFLGQALAYRPFADALNGRDQLLGPMGWEELRAAVERPAEKLNVTFEEGLVACILDDVGEEPGNLPLLEFALAQLWEQQELGRLTHRAYNAIGGVAGALAQHAEEVFAGLSEEEQARAREVFIQLVQPGEGTEDTRRKATREELGDARWRMVQRLATRRLVVTGQDAAGREVAEVAHEALIQRWGRLRGWMEEYRDFRLWQERMRGAYRQWKENGEDKDALLRGRFLDEALEWLARRGDEVEEPLHAYIRASREHTEAERAEVERRRRRLAQAGLGAALLFLILTLLSGWKWQQAEEQKNLALAHGWAAIGQLEFDRIPNGPFIGTALGIESMRMVRSLEGDQLLRQGLLLLPRPVAWMTHENWVNAVAFSPDGRWVVSGSNDYTARVWEAATGREVARMRHDGSVLAVAFSPDERWVVSGGADNTARVWEATTGREVARMMHDGSVRAVAFSPDGKRVVSGSWNGTVWVWEAATGQKVRQMTHDGRVRAVAFSSDGKWVVSGSDDGTVRIWEATSGREMVYMTHDRGVLVVAFSPSGQRVVSGSWDSTARVWETATGQEVTRVTHDAPVYAVAFSPDGQWVISGSMDRTARVWETITGREVARMTHDGPVRVVAFSPDGQWVVSGGGDNTVQVWEISTGQEVAQMTHDGPVYAVASSITDEQWVVSGSWDGTARVWEATTGREVAQMPHNGAVKTVAFSPDGQWVVSGSMDRTARVWEAATGQEVARMTHDGPVKAIAFSPDGRRVISGSEDGTARVWGAAIGQEVARITHDGPVNAVAFSPDGKWGVSGSDDRTARVWEAATGQEVARMVHENWVNAVAFSPDGKWVVSGSDDRTARVWEAVTGQEVARMTHDGPVYVVAFSPDGRWVISGSDDRTARVWEAATGQEIARMAHDDTVYAATFSHDGRWVASGSRKGTVRVWEAATGQEVARMAQARRINAVVFTPDGQWVVSGSADGTARVWPWRTEDLIEEACRRMPRNLTHEEWNRYIGPEIPYHPTCPNLPVPEP